MKKFYLLSAILAVAGSMSAHAGEPAEVLPAPVFEPQPAVIGYVSGRAVVPPRAARNGAAPASIVGKKYVSFYNSFVNYGDRAGSMIVEQLGTDSVLLRDFAMGYDVRAKYDASTGQLTIPTNVPIGKTSAGATITLYRLVAADNFSKYDQQPVIGTFDGDKFFFTDGLYAISTTSSGNSGYVWMSNLKGREANAMLKTNQMVFSSLSPGTDYEYPVYVAKTGANRIEVQGMAQWLYSHNYKVPFTINQTANTATLSTSDSVDWYRGSETDIRSCFMLYRKVDTVNSVSNNPVFDVTAGQQSKIKAQKFLFEAYKKAGSTSWSGWLLNPFEITMDFNIYTAPVVNVDTVGSVIYQVDPDSYTAKVTGCVADATELDIKPTITYHGEQYIVTEIVKNAFSAKKTVIKLTIPSTVRTIGSGAFSTMTALNEVHLPDVRTWCDIYREASTSTFFSLAGMFNKTDSTAWGKVYFEGIAEPNPRDIQIPEGVTDLRYAFHYYRPLRSVTFASTVREAYYAFDYCSNLASVKLNENLENMQYAFYACTSLLSVEIPRGVKTIGQRAFYNCSKIAELTLHTGLTNIDAYAFYSNKGLTRVVLPSSLDSLGSSVFGSCSNITSVVCRATTPPAVFGDNVFSAFVSKATLSVPEGTTDAYKEAKGWNKFTTFDNTVGVNATGYDENENAPAEYYNLNGYRISAERLTPGLYIKVQGNKTTKVLVK